MLLVLALEALAVPPEGQRRFPTRAWRASDREGSSSHAAPQATSLHGCLTSPSPGPARVHVPPPGQRVEYVALPRTAAHPAPERAPAPELLEGLLDPRRPLEPDDHLLSLAIPWQSVCLSRGQHTLCSQLLGPGSGGPSLL
jgi:hypothetical protein